MANIRTARRSGLVLRGGRNVRETRWGATSVVQGTPMAASTAILLTSLGATVLAMRPLTIVRTRGVILGRSDQSAASEDYSFGYGHAVVSEQAVAIGVTAVPTPMTDADSDLWFVYESVIGQLIFSDATGIFEAGQRVAFDSKAMRKVEDGQDAISVVETSSLSAGAIIQVQFRCLFKLH